MKEYKYSGSYDDAVLATLYDQKENYTDDIELLRRLIDPSVVLNILECFSGTGRILIRLAQDGHSITGIEIAPAMNARAIAKIAQLSAEVKNRIILKVQDVLDGNWGTEFDLVLLAANAFYELPSAQVQEQCIEFANWALKPEGLVFIDNDDYKRDWHKGPFGKERVIFEGFDEAGIYGRYALTGLRFDDKENIFYMKRSCYKRMADGKEEYIEYIGKKHPVSAGEVKDWLQKYNFEIIHLFGDRKGNPYTKESERAIFWARKTV